MQQMLRINMLSTVDKNAYICEFKTKRIAKNEEMP